MKKFFYLVAVLLLLAACKPSERHYRAAYESTIARRDSLRSLGETIYGRYRERTAARPIVLGEDTLWVTTELIAMTEGLGATDSTLQRYCIVGGRFKQLFNAREMRRRMQGMGYPDAMVLNTQEPLYYVVLASESTAQGALDALRHIQADTALTLREPCPYVLQPAHMAR